MSRVFEYFTRLSWRGLRGALAEEGAAVVEMALSSVVLFAVFFGIFQVSLACYTYNYVSDAAREGSRWAIVRGGASCKNTGITNCGASATDISNYVKNLGYPGINSTAYMTVTTNWYSPSAGTPTTWTLCSGSGCNTPGNLVKVVVSYAFPLSVPFVPANTISVSSTSQMVIAQ
jgi:Flp pilus assembly protein TadG